jgi:hypothetical protein
MKEYMMEPTALKLGNKKSEHVTEKSDFNRTPMEPSPLKIRNKAAPSMTNSGTCVVEPKPLSIKPRELVDNSPKPLSIVSSEPKVSRQYDMKFDLSIEYLRSKIPNITTFMYSQIRPILDNIERTDTNRQDTDVLDFGKFLQDVIASKAMEINKMNGHEVILEVQTSHELIIECVEVSAKKSFFGSITDSIFGKTIKREDVKKIIEEEMIKNKIYRTEIAELMQKYPRYEVQLVKLREEMSLYIEVAKLLASEFEAEGFHANVDLINRRINSLFSSNAVLETSIGIVKLNSQKLSLYGDNIDNILNVLMPTLLTKISLSQTDDADYLRLSEQIIQKLKV